MAWLNTLLGTDITLADTHVAQPPRSSLRNGQGGAETSFEQELARLRDELTREKRRAEQAAQEAAIREQNERRRTEKEYRQAIEHRDRWKDEAFRLHDVATDTEKKRDVAVRQLNEVYLQYDIARKDLDHVSVKYNAAMKEIEQLRRQLDAANQERESLIKLSETRRLETEAALTYFDTSGAASEHDVVCCIRNLNAEMFQAVKGISDSFLAGPPVGSLSRAEGRVKGIVGKPILQLLRRFHRHRDDIFIVEIASQAIISFIVQVIASSWDLTKPEDALFGLVYDNMLLKECQSVAGRWRALSRKHLRLLNEEDSKEDSLTRFLHEHLSSVLLIAGGSGEVSQKTTESLRVIVRSALNLRHSINERITESEYVVTVGHFDGEFSPEEMEDAFAVKGKATKENERVACAHELGLTRLEAEGGTAGVLKEVVLVKPTVVLISLLNELALSE
ncbi:uncharacterized protein LAESUDRAFT_760342 [Laetiporus sulphureus 93-53]|uniref:Uncharacterized protein n=1 Tax=Laetiporus sulphureus 93-53 TaxID=1314785 RepID=A0A165DRH8_9APHY|nr:uncharacterized protein LAESUDRAFT_760342 [Laetiporus sulphureus 93-53]KZT05475.1 hypothetical protein LAESUDRAFT_760342 [Laetiporus sulphureus 93-53]